MLCETSCTDLGCDEMRPMRLGICMGIFAGVGIGVAVSVFASVNPVFCMPCALGLALLGGWLGYQRLCDRCKNLVTLSCYEQGRFHSEHQNDIWYRQRFSYAQPMLRY
jgi:hypothetical protein